MRILFVYWGRRGINRLVRDVIAAADRAGIDWRLSLSENNIDGSLFRPYRDRVSQVRTFHAAAAALTWPWKRHGLIKSLSQAFGDSPPDAIVTLMPHVWSAASAEAAQRLGARYATILHDAQRHPGDPTGIVHGILMHTAMRADTVFVLSRAVARAVTAARPALKPVLLFHPLAASRQHDRPTYTPGEPLRLLFLGRILPYKGLPKLIEAVEQLKNEGMVLTLSVQGAGALGPMRQRLESLGASVQNHWLTEEQFEAALSEHHVLVLPYSEASQSGPAAAALAAGMPVVATPVGGLSEQVEDGVTGLITADTSVTAIADSLRRFASEPGLCDVLSAGARSRRTDRTPDEFVRRMICALQTADREGRTHLE